MYYSNSHIHYLSLVLPKVWSVRVQFTTKSELEVSFMLAVTGWQRPSLYYSSLESDYRIVGKFRWGYGEPQNEKLTHEKKI